MKIDPQLTAESLLPDTDRLFRLAADKCRRLDESWDPANGTPVFTVDGTYTTRGWTEWTQGFVYGNCILTGDALGDQELIDLGRRRTIDHMLPHVTHTGVHDHGFNNLSTYGNLLRLMHEGKLPADSWEQKTYENAIAASGAVQAARWSGTPAVDSPYTAGAESLGYVYSFNGPHSLFIDTMRTIRILGVAWQLGHVLMHEGDRAANLLKRSVLHGLTTSHYIVFHGPPEASAPPSQRQPHAAGPYNVAGRTAHEGTFNRNDGAFRSRATQQGYSAFSTWTRGLAWAVTGYAEQLEFLHTLDPDAFQAACGLALPSVISAYERCAQETADHFINGVTAADGVVYWDDGAPGLAAMGDWRGRDAEPYNDHEPVDSGASAIAAQGLVRLGRYLDGKSDLKTHADAEAPAKAGTEASGTAHADAEPRSGEASGQPGSPGSRYLQAGLTCARTLMSDPYLATDPSHQGILLHNIYHRPNGWDHIPAGSKIPAGESAMWGDYHLLELAHLVKRLGDDGPYPTFFLKDS